MGKLREEIDNYLGAEMVTLGTSIDDAKTGQMWAFDSERLSKGVLSLVCKRIEGARFSWKDNVKGSGKTTNDYLKIYDEEGIMGVVEKATQAQHQASIDAIKEE